MDDFLGKNHPMLRFMLHKGKRSKPISNTCIRISTRLKSFIQDYHEIMEKISAKMSKYKRKKINENVFECEIICFGLVFIEVHRL